MTELGVPDSMTETKQYLRLLEFFFRIKAFAAVLDDAELDALVEDCRQDLFEMYGAAE